MLLAGIGAAVAVAASLVLLLPANAQFWGDSWGGRQRGGWGGWDRGGWDRGGWDRPYREREYREAPVDFSRAPAATPKKEATTHIVVMGDAMADWLAYGLEDAYSEKPDVGIVRKHRTDSGLIRYDPRRDNVDWAQTIRETVAAEKPQVIVMMVGNNDRQSIREKAPVVVRQPPGAAKAKPQPQQTITPDTKPPLDAELQRPEAPEPPVPTTEQARIAAYGPWEFQSEKWEAAYIKRVDATMAALKSSGVPVLWVGLPSRSVAKVSNDSSYLNEIYRSRAEKFGITYVDIWDGFVDEQGRYSAQGPDYEGQIRRLRSGDGVYFTKFGARKLAHYVEREIERFIGNRLVPVALPIPSDPDPKGSGAAPTKPGVPQRPSAGPVLPLTAPPKASEELLGGSRAPPRPSPVDPVAARVITSGEPVSGPVGRADDFSWPRGTVADEPAAVTPAAMTAGQKPPQSAVSEAQLKADAQQKAAADAQRRARQVQRDPVRSFFNNPTQLFRGFGRW
jgi:hypothetical protein